VPKKSDPAAVTLEAAVELLAAREDKLKSQGKDPRAPKKRGARRPTKRK
jgi:topoisomerase IA-like protein